MSTEATEIESPIPPALPMPGATHSPSIAKLVEALAKATLEFGDVAKGRENPYYHSRYADLADVIAATRIPLAKHGLTILQTPTVALEAHRAGVVTLLCHASGEWLSSQLTLPAEMQGRDGKLRFDGQSVGSALTYARRYSLQAILNIAAEDDDDGNSTVGNGEKSKSEPGAQPGKPSARRAEAWRAIEEAEKPADLLATATKVRDDKLIPAELKTELIDIARERMWDFSQKTIVAVTTPEEAEKSAKFYGGCWLLTPEQRTQIVSALGAVREELLEAQAKQEVTA